MDVKINSIPFQSQVDFQIPSTNHSTIMSFDPKNSKSHFQPACILNLSSVWRFEFSKKNESDKEIIDESFITEYALKYKEYKDQITNSGLNEESQKPLLEELDGAFMSAVEEKANALSSSFDSFFDYQKHIYDKYLSEPIEGIFDEKEFKNYLIDLAKGAIHAADGVQNQTDARSMIKSYLEKQEAKDQTLEHMSFHDLRTLSAFFLKLPVLDKDHPSYQKLMGTWVTETEKLFNSKQLSVGAKNAVQLTVFRNLKLYKMEAEYTKNFKDNNAQMDIILNELKKAKISKANMEEDIKSGNNLTMQNQLRIMKRMNQLDEKIKSLKLSLEKITESKTENEKGFKKALKADSKDNYSQYQKDFEKSRTVDESSKEFTAKYAL